MIPFLVIDIGITVFAQQSLLLLEMLFRVLRHFSQNRIERGISLMISDDVIHLIDQTY